MSTNICENDKKSPIYVGIAGGIFGLRAGIPGAIIGFLGGYIGGAILDYLLEDDNDDGKSNRKNDGVLNIVFWDVQHGSATYIKTPNGKHIIQDLGTGSYKDNNKEFSPLLHIKNKYGINKLDHVIITHIHKDHIDDIMNLDELSPCFLTRPDNLPKDQIMQKVDNEYIHLYEKYFEIDDKYSDNYLPEKNPFLTRNNGGAKIQIFYPNLKNISNINDYSIVTVITYAESKIILPGDNMPTSWRVLLERDDFIDAIKDADIFLAPHHGRTTSFYSELFDHFEPKIIIISDGPFSDTSATNKYSQISSGWLVRHRSGQKEKRKCLTTRKDGVIVIKLGYNSNDPFIDITID